MTQISLNRSYNGNNSLDSFYAMCLKQPPIKTYFSKCLLKVEKSPLGFLWEVAFPLTLYNFGGGVERDVGRSQGAL